MVAIKPDYAAHEMLGFIYITQKKYEKAIASYKKAIGIHPNNAEAHAILGTAYIRTGRLDKAIAESQNALSINPNMAWVYYYLVLAQ